MTATKHQIINVIVAGKSSFSGGDRPRLKFDCTMEVQYTVTVLHDT